MSDTEITQPDPKVEAQAREMGWRPQAEFKGDPGKWVDAETYVKKGEEYLPFVRAENRRLKAEIDGMKGQLTEAQEAIKASVESLEGMKEFYSEETKRRVAEARKDVVAQIKQAREAGDIEAEADLLGQLGEIDEATRAAAAKPTATPKPTPAPKANLDPDYVAWQKDNPWFGPDRKKTALAVGIAEEVSADPETKDLRGRAFYEEIGRRVEEYLSGGRPASKVEDGVGGGGRGGGGKKGFSDLPKEAQDACDRLASKVVGKGRAHKDMASWRQSYAEQYFSE